MKKSQVAHPDCPHCSSLQSQTRPKDSSADQRLNGLGRQRSGIEDLRLVLAANKADLLPPEASIARLEVRHPSLLIAAV